MDHKKFKDLLKYYLSCMDAEGTAHLKLGKNQENKSYILAENAEEERFFSQGLAQIEIPVINQERQEFIERRAPNAETLVSLYYGFPVFMDKKDMLAPLFYMEVEASFSNAQSLRLIP